MPLQKLTLKPGVNRENTRYTNEGRWYESDKVRFRFGTPEKIGGWEPISQDTYLGTCRSLFNWSTLNSASLLGVGTNLKYYIEANGDYYDITPFRTETTLTNPFATTLGSATVTVTDAAGGVRSGDYVAFYGATAVGGLTLFGEYQVTVQSATTYTITASAVASSTATGGGTVYALYYLTSGPAFVYPLLGWGAGTWGADPWGTTRSSYSSIQLWSQTNFGEDLIFGPRGGAIYYWDASLGYTATSFTASVAAPSVISVTVPVPEGMPIRFVPGAGGVLPTGLIPGQLYYARNVVGTTFNVSTTPSGSLIAVTLAGTGTNYLCPNAYKLSDMSGGSAVPLQQNILLVSDASRFVFAFGATEYGGTELDPMLIRWSDQEDPTNWTPEATNQAGFLRLSRGTSIVTAIQAQQAIYVWTDTSLYALQFVGAPIVWSSQIVAESISIVSQNAVAYANNVAYWMGRDKFYMFNGQLQTINCDLRRHVFSNFNYLQKEQVFAGTNEAFNEVWWFYCSKNSNTIDRYVVFNYTETIWYYGTMARTAWLDTSLRNYPIAATYSNTLVQHESGVDDNETGTPLPMTAYVTSSEFDLEDGHNFMFIWRVLPDITFDNSTTETPSVTMFLMPLSGSGSGYLVNQEPDENHSVAGTSYATVSRISALPIERFTNHIYTRVRGRQMAIKVESTGLGVNWQLGSPRFDARPDGKR